MSFSIHTPDGGWQVRLSQVRCAVRAEWRPAQLKAQQPGKITGTGNKRVKVGSIHLPASEIVSRVGRKRAGALLQTAADFSALGFPPSVAKVASVRGGRPFSPPCHRRPHTEDGGTLSHGRCKPTNSTCTPVDITGPDIGPRPVSWDQNREINVKIGNISTQTYLG